MHKLARYLILTLMTLGSLGAQFTTLPSAGGGSSTPAADITTGLQNYLDFETDLTTDDGSEGATLIWTNSPTLRTDGCAAGDQCVELDGTSQHGAFNITLPTSGDFTIAVWGYLDAVGGADYLWAAHDGSSTVAELGLFLDNEGDYSVFANAVATERMSELRQETFATWNHYAITRKDGATTVYFNAVPVEAFILDSTFNFSTCDLLIGTEADSGCASSLGNYWDGRIDEFRVYTRALTETDILGLPGF